MTDFDNLPEKEFQIAMGALEDSRRFIAAHKVQRWEVLKWGVSINLALAAVLGTPGLVALDPHLKVFLVIIGLAVVVAGVVLVYRYNTQMTLARKGAVTIESWLQKHGLIYEAITGVNLAKAYENGEDYDKIEVISFYVILVCSGLAVLLSFFFLQKQD